jgi:hypothetical protein
MRFVSMLLGGFLGLAAVVTLVGCDPSHRPVMQTCPSGKPWVPDQYANGKWVPGHCEGEAAI